MGILKMLYSLIQWQPLIRTTELQKIWVKHLREVTKAMSLSPALYMPTYKTLRHAVLSWRVFTVLFSVLFAYKQESRCTVIGFHMFIM